MPFGFKTVRELVGDLTERVRVLEVEVKAITQEWDETYDKMTRKAARDRKRARDESERGSSPGGNGVDVGRPVGNIPLSVLARRRQGGSGFGRDEAAPAE